jgi:hypothetical protein
VHSVGHISDEGFRRSFYINEWIIPLLNFVKLYRDEYEHCECDFWAPTTTEVPGWVGLT